MNGSRGVVRTCTVSTSTGNRRAPDRSLRVVVHVTPRISAVRGRRKHKVVQQLFELPQDLQPVDVELNRLNDQVLVRYYEQEWRGFE